MGSHTFLLNISMAAFRFNFMESDDHKSPTTNVKEEPKQDKKSTTAGSYQEHHPDLNQLSVTNRSSSTSCQKYIQLHSSETIYYTKLDEIKEGPDNNLVVVTDNAHSDLLPGQYEGGLKIWECTYDLLDYMTGIDFKGKNVLDLGCGSGLLGIYALTKGAKEVHYQDFNPEVIQDYTIPNVSLNKESIAKSVSCLQGKEISWTTKCRFFSGHWSNFRPQCKSESFTQLMKYDIILTSETIYNLDTHSILLQVLYDLLHSKGTVYVAAKTHYFGVGGTLGDFIDQIKEDEILSYTQVKNIPSCVPRAILELKVL